MTPYVALQHLKLHDRIKALKKKIDETKDEDYKLKLEQELFEADRELEDLDS